jgi:molecular chaperone GrpE (heat shock protein)
MSISDDSKEQLEHKAVIPNISSQLSAESNNDVESNVKTPETIENLGKQFASIEEKLDFLTSLFHEKIQDDTTKADLFDKLYQTLADYRDDFIFKHVLQRVFADLIRLLDTLEDTLEEKTLENLQREDLIDRFRSFQQQILKTLKRQDIVPIESLDSQEFDEAIQEAVDTRPVNSPEADQTVIEVLRKGFKYRERILRSAQVIVGRYDNEKVAQDIKDSGIGLSGTE